MKSLLLILLFTSLPLVGVEKVDPTDPRKFQENETIELVEKKVSVLEKKPASRLYRAWVNPVQTVKHPSAQAKTMQMIQPGVRQPHLEPTFSQLKKWKPAKVVQLYEKSKDFDKVLNPLSLRDFNRFIYQRNPNSP